ncbi:gas vesicle protein GvpJ [Nonomuraea sp. NPDC046570]|uniref:gas vesicle protein GvpJ n=1 Tax=Nonomuraea sp. NPDC046570 TaxID=3155255 RepID=UPI0033FD958B
MTVQPASAGPAGGPSGLADVIDTILDKGLVIDAYVRVSLIGIEILTVDARIVVASVDTYLRFAEAVNRLDLTETAGPGLPDLVGNVQQGQISDKSKEMAQGVLEAAGEKLHDFVGDHASGDEKARHRGRKEG